MTDSSRQSPEESKDDETSPWIVIGAASALGFEFMGFVLAGVFIGTRIDAHFDSEPVGLLVSVALALVAVGWHIYLVSRRFLKNGET